MKKFILPIVLAIVFGYLCANYVLALYEENYDNIANYYFLQVGAYKNKESSIDDFKSIKNKITIKEDNKYYTYIGITASKEEANYIKKLYKKNNIEVYIKEKNITNQGFIQELKQYDILLKSSKTLEEINSILSTILATYEEEVLNNK